MADILKYKVVNATEGAIHIHPGLNRDQIIKISRQGIQHDFVSILFWMAANNRSWTFLSPMKRIIFKDAFAAGEKIHIIYKVTL